MSAIRVGILIGIIFILLNAGGTIFVWLSTDNLINAGVVLPAYASTYDVTDPAYGATPNDASDDTDEINAAITAALTDPNPSILKFPSGTFRINSQLTIDGVKNLAVSGPGTINLTVEAANVIRLTHANGLTVNGSLHVIGWQDGSKMQSHSDGTLKVGGGISVDSNSDNVTIKDCTVSNTNLAGIIIKDTINAKVINCDVGNARTSIRFYNVTNGVISDNNLHDQRADGIYLENATSVSNVNITNNVITRFGDTAIDAASNSNNIRITNNNVTAAYSVVDQNIAFATYKSSDGANGLQSPKYREWNLTSSQWGSQVELPVAEANKPIRDIKIFASPTTSERAIIAKVENSGGLYLYTCFANCTLPAQWTKNNVTSNANVWNSNVPYKGFAAAYEQLSGSLLIVYDKNVTSTTDVWYRTWADGALSTEQSGPNFIAGDNNELRQIELASSPTSDKIAMVLEDATNQDARAFMWSGTAWDSGQLITGTLGATSITGLPVAVEFQSNGNAVAFSGNGSNSITSCLYVSSWCSSPTNNSDPNSALWNNVMFLSAKRNPATSSSQVMLCQVDNLTDMNCTRYLSGSSPAWPSSVLDSNMDTYNSNRHSFEWDSTGNNQGLLTYGTTSGKLTYRFYNGTSANFGTATEIVSGTTHPWFAMARNPVSGDKIKVLGMYQTNASPFDIGAFNWTGVGNAPKVISDNSTFTSDMGTTNGVQAFDLAFENSNKFASDPTGIDPNGLGVSIQNTVTTFTLQNNRLIGVSNGASIDGSSGTVTLNTISYKGIKADRTKLLVQSRYIGSCPGGTCFDQFGMKIGAQNSNFTNNTITSPVHINNPMRWNITKDKLRNMDMNIYGSSLTLGNNNYIYLYSDQKVTGSSTASANVENYGIRIGSPAINDAVNNNTIHLYAGAYYKSMLEETGRPGMTQVGNNLIKDVGGTAECRIKGFEYNPCLQ
jgi:parallel beta-helix repeat protein